MTSGLWQRLDLAARVATPAMTTLLLTLLSVIPIDLPSYANVAPILALSGIYYWASYRPTHLPFAISFSCGLFADILTGGPMGISSLTFMTGHWIVLNQRRTVVGKSFTVLWLGFGMLVGFVTALDWFLHSVYEINLMPLQPTFFRAVMTIVTFPLIAAALIQVHRRFLQPAG